MSTCQPIIDNENMIGKIEIKSSRIKNAGFGVYAKKTIKKDTRLDEYRGRIIDAKEFNRLRNTQYVFEVAKKIAGKYQTCYIDAKDPKQSNWTRYINGAKTSTQKKKINIRAYQYDGKIFYKTIKNIPEGQEIITDYGDGYWVD